MTTLKESGLQGLLNKARKLGIIEEDVAVMGHNVVLQNLSPEALSEVIQEMESLENSHGAVYLYTQQVEQLCRAIIEIDGQDLRDVKYIEVEEANPKKPNEMLTVKVPKHQWLRDNMVSWWGREAIHTLYLKLLDVTDEAETRSREGVTFKTAAETEEEKFRRLLVEALAAGEEVPDDMKAAIFKENGLHVAASVEELEQANAEAKRFLEEQRALQAEQERLAQEVQEEPVEPEVAPEPEPEVVPETPAPVGVPSQIRQAAAKTPEELMASRTPLNRTPIHAPVPQAHDVKTQVINKRPPRPSAEQVAPLMTERASKRAAEYAALEADASAGGIPLDVGVPQQVFRAHPGSAVLENSIQDTLKPSKIAIDAPPRGGVNRKFVDGTQGGGLNPRKS